MNQSSNAPTLHRVLYKVTNPSGYSIINIARRVIVTPGYTTVDDIPAIIAMKLGVAPDAVQVLKTILIDESF